MSANNFEGPFETLIRTSPSFMCILSGPDYVFEHANEQYLKLVGGRDILGKKLADALPEIKAQGFIEILDQVRTTGNPFIGKEVEIFLQTSPDSRLEKRYLDFVYKLDRTAQGESRIVAHGLDVTEKTLSRTEIENERENFRNLFRQTPEMVCILSGPNHLFEFVNEAHIKVLGFDATGREVREAQPESVEIHGILDNVYLTGKTAELFEIPVTVSDRLRYFNLTYAARRDLNDRISGVMVLGTEVTEQIVNRQELLKAKDQSLAANKAKSRFLANVSHEIRTPLSAVVGYSELLKSCVQNNSTALSYIERISHNAANLSRLVDELLDLTKIEAEKLEVEFEVINLDALLDDVFAMMRLRAHEKSIELNLEWLTKKPDRVVTDPLRFSQILINVLGNAVKFTSTGSVDVKIRTEDGYLVITVTDTGIGMSDEEQSRIFSPFEQADPSINRKYGGTGLGLALSKKLSKLLRGDLRLEKSIAGVGTTFRIEIAIENEPAIAQNESPKIFEKSEAPLVGKKILIVDDSPDNREIASLFLQAAGALCADAENGQVGVELARKEEFDIVLMDIQMPVLDGYQAMKALKELNYSKPVIAVTAHAFKEEKYRCLEAGFSDYVTKPIDRTRLIQTILKFS